MGSEIQMPEFPVKGDLRYVRLRARGGFGFEPSPLRAQREDTMMMDSDRSYFTLGAGVETWDPFELIDGPVRIDAFMQYHLLSAATLARQSDVPRAGFPVGASGLPVGGNVVVFGAEWNFEY
jgi:hypothetical protein